MRSKRSSRALAQRNVIFETRPPTARAVRARRPPVGAALGPHAADTPARRFFKRALDIGVAAPALLLCAPIILACAAIVACVSPGAPFFSQRRVGLRGRVFRIYKLRTMRAGACDAFVPTDRKPRVNPRVFAFGALLRKTSLDELPNLCNVLRGEMSIVGPRPMLAEEVALCVARHGESVSEERLAVRPGMTGLWQISGRAERHFDERIRLDVRYVRTWSPLGDLVIIAKTVPTVLFGTGAF